MQCVRLSDLLAKVVIFGAVTATLCSLSAAQGFFKKPEVNVVAGYSLQRFDATKYNFSATQNLQGGFLEVSLPNLYQGWGVAADFSGHWNDQLETFNFLIGPQYRFELKGVDFFAHGLGGKSRSRLLKLGTSQIEPSSLGATFAMGGGADIPIGKRFSIRAAQVDYLINSAFGSKHYDLRYSSGIVISFGKKAPPPSF
jgi:hypothetical protein